METYIVVIGTRHGKRAATRHPLNVPVALARGHYEQLSDRALNDALKDMHHEQRRRRGEPLEQPAELVWTPFDTQITEEPNDA